jgi:hypothetical protein
VLKQTFEKTINIDLTYWWKLLGIDESCWCFFLSAEPSTFFVLPLVEQITAGQSTNHSDCSTFVDSEAYASLAVQRKTKESHKMRLQIASNPSSHHG